MTPASVMSFTSKAVSGCTVSVGRAKGRKHLVKSPLTGETSFCFGSRPCAIIGSGQFGASNAVFIAVRARVRTHSD